MKVLIVYYTRTNTTDKVAQKLAEKLNADVEKLVDETNRDWVIGYLKAGRDASIKKLTVINDLKYDPSKYDIVILWTPVWAFTIVPAIRTYVHNNDEQIHNMACFCTMWSSGESKVYSELAKLTGKKPLATLGLKTKQVQKDDELVDEKITEFVDNLKKNYNNK